MENLFKVTGEISNKNKFKPHTNQQIYILLHYQDQTPLLGKTIIKLF